MHALTNSGMRKQPLTKADEEMLSGSRAIHSI